MNVLDDVGMVPTPAPPAHACDTCGARAFVFAEVKGTELAYCMHHGSIYLPKLRTLSTVIVDLRDTVGP